MKCGRCWKEGHPGTRCLTKKKVPGEQPALNPPKPNLQPPFEPLFDDLLEGPLPHRWPDMPAARPEMMSCFLDKDEEYEEELFRLRQGVVVQAIGWEGDLRVDAVVAYAVATGLVQPEELAVASLSCSSCLIHLPATLAPDTFLRAIPARIWDLGLEFQPWSPYLAATKAVPEYKVLLELRDLPVRLWRERNVKRVVSSFGVFLGSISPPHAADYAAWKVVVATDRLQRIPQKMEVTIGGIKSVVRVLPIKWSQSPIYSKEDMPVQPPVFIRPSPIMSPNGGSPTSDDMLQDEEDMIRLPRRVVMQMCTGRDLNSLPPDVHQYLNNSPTSTEAGDTPEYQPLALAIQGEATEKATENPGSNNPNESSHSGAQRIPNPEEDAAHTVPNLSNVTILRRDSVEAGMLSTSATQRATPIQATPVPDEQSIEGHKALTSPVGAENQSEPSTTVLLSTSEDVAPLARGDDRLITMCPQPLLIQEGSGLQLGPQVGKRKPKPKNNDEAGPSKRNSTGPLDVEPLLGLDGFYNIKVSDSHIAKLAEGWGLLPDAVRREVTRDHEERLMALTQVPETQLEEEEGATGVDINGSDSGMEL